MTRLTTALAFSCLLPLASACATTTPAVNKDGTGGDTGADFGDTLPDMPGDTGTIDTGLPDTIPPDVHVDPTTEPVPDTTTGGVVGDPCYSAGQCGGVPGAGVTCLTSIMGYITFPGGYCSAVCTSDADCGPTGACVNISDLGRYCLKRCVSAGDCRTAEGYHCDPVTGNPGTFCIPEFTSPEAAG